MTLVQIDPSAVRDLSAALSREADAAEGASDSLRSALVLAELDGTVAGRLDDRVERWRTAAATLELRATEAEAHHLGLDMTLGGPLVQAVEYVGGSLGPSLAHVDDMAATLLRLEDGLAALGTGSGPVAAAMAAQSEALRREIGRLTGASGDLVDVFVVVRGIDRLTEEIVALDRLDLSVARAMGVETLRAQRDELLDRFASILPADAAADFTGAVRAGAPIVDALGAIDPDPARSAGLSSALSALRAHGGTTEQAFRDGAIGLDDLYHLDPVDRRGPDYFLPLTAYEPQPHWTTGEVAHYWQFLWFQQHDAMDPDQRQAIVERSIAEMPGVPTVEPVDDGGGGIAMAFGDLFRALVGIGQWVASAVDGCLAVGGLASLSAPVVAAYVSTMFFPVSGGLLVAGACVAGAVTYAGVPGTRYDGIGPVGLP